MSKFEKTWYGLREAAEKKGVRYRTLQNRKILCPNGGTEDAIITGRKMWNWKTIEEWLLATDEELLKKENNDV